MWNILAASLALIGTLIQMFDQLRAFKDADPQAASTFATIEAWRDEESPLRPLRWLQRRRVIAALLKASPSESSAYRRVRGVVRSWILLFAASCVAFIGSAMSLIV